MNKDHISIVLQGYATSPQQLRETIKGIVDQGYNRVVVSTYSNCAPTTDTVIDKSNYILNNIYEQGELLTDGPSSLDSGGRPQNLKVATLFPFPELGYYSNIDTGLQGRANNTNFQLITTQRGIRKIFEKYPSTKYILKIRADLAVFNLDTFFENAIERIQKFRGSNLFFESKILGELNNRSLFAWLNDFYFFGTKQDIYNLFNIPYLQNYEISPEQYICQTFINSQSTTPVFWQSECRKYFDFNPDCHPKSTYYDLMYEWKKHTNATTDFSKHI